MGEMETYMTLSNASLKMKNIYLKIYSNLLKKYFEEDRDSIAFNDSTLEFQNIFMLMHNKFSELILKYNNIINEKNPNSSGENVFQTKNLYDTEKNINDYIALNFELNNIHKDLLSITNEINKKITKNENTISIIKHELSLSSRLFNTMDKYGLMDKRAGQEENNNLIQKLREMDKRGGQEENNNEMNKYGLMDKRASQEENNNLMEEKLQERQNHKSNYFKNKRNEMNENKYNTRSFSRKNKLRPRNSIEEDLMHDNDIKEDELRM